MNRLESLFQQKRNNVLNVYCTAGFPHLDSTIEVMDALQKHGADIIELGMPYSDPIADGPVIQHSNAIALENGISITKLFEQLRGFRQKIFSPVILMGYMNPVLQYGFEKFCKNAADVAIDGLIIPDLPAFEFENEYGPMIRKYGLSFIFLVTPETSEARIRKFDELSTGFLYAVSSSSTTGKDADLSLQEPYFRKLRDMKLYNPVLVGFGIHDNKSFSQASQNLNGAIIGSAYIKALEKEGGIEANTKTFLQAVLTPAST
ncbi:MAG: tryptophan synthase subunit alpha [Chitinophagaceae bacterium]